MARKTSGITAETDLYKPICGYLTKHGYTVRGEVNDCDVTAVKDDDLIVIELKRAFSTTLLIQATKRQKITGSVYIALPYPTNGTRNAHWKGVRHLLRRLELGLILVHLDRDDPLVEVAFHPLPYQNKKQSKLKRAVLKEIEARSGDFNQGGSTRKKLMTAYRENAIHIACCLDKYGPLTPKALRDLGTGPKTLSILSANFYGWFERVSKGIYQLKPASKAEVESFDKIVLYYREILNKQDIK